LDLGGGDVAEAVGECGAVKEFAGLNDHLEILILEVDVGLEVALREDAVDVGGNG
jgi:hypothetical protein